jgi:ribose transport system ATP-binding protein
MTDHRASRAAMRIRKAFPGVVALDGVDFNLRAGEVHVLLGENGAGKSTLMKILSGAYAKDAGEIVLDGATVSIGSPRDAQSLGIATIYQELSLVPQLTVAENILLGHEPGRAGVIDRTRLREAARRSLDEVGMDIDPNRRVDRLGIAEQQMVEVAKALFRRARVLVMDEPTSALTAREIDRLFEVIARRARACGRLHFASHADGRHRSARHRAGDGRDGTFPPDADELIRPMANAKSRSLSRRARCTPAASCYPRARLGASGVEDVSLTVCRRDRRLAGLLGVAAELARIIFGADPASRGRVLVNGVDVTPKTPKQAIAAGIGFLPEDRKRQGLVLTLSVCDNIGLPNLVRWSRGGVVSGRTERDAAERWVTELRIKTPNVAIDRPATATRSDAVDGPSRIAG